MTVEAGTGAAPEPGPAARYLDGRWHRLHPATPLLRGGIGLLAVVLWLVAQLRERIVGLFFGFPDQPGDPLDELGRHHLFGIAALVVLGALLVGVGLFWVSWRASTFRIGEDAVTVRNGVLLRTTRTARLDRIQGVTISRPLLARLVGAARLELDVAGQNANVRLEYLGAASAEDLRGDVLRLASGRRQREGAPPVADAAVAGPRILRITPGRAIGSVLLSDTTVVLVVIAGVVIPVMTALGAAAAAAVSLFPYVIASVTVAARRVGRNLRYSVVAGDDGVRIASGVVSTSSEALPPGRVHALRLEQPLLWRPAGWWRVSVNRAGQAAGRRAGERTLAPVATLAEVLALVPHLVPDLADREALLLAGLSGRPSSASGGSGDGDDFTRAPRRARWLRPVAWRRTGFRLSGATILYRAGFLKRELVIVPEARVQSVSLRQGPLERLLGVATVHPHVVAGPVRTAMDLVDRQRAERLFIELSTAGAGAREADVSHRWAEERRAVAVAAPVEPEPAP